AGNEVKDDLRGIHVFVDADGTVGGDVVMIWLDEGSNIDYGIYQDGTATNHLGGDTSIGGTVAPAGQLHVDQGSATGTQPVAFFDQGDVDEPHIVCSINGTDVNFPAILQLDITGTPTLGWAIATEQLTWDKHLFLTDGNLYFATARGLDFVDDANGNLLVLNAGLYLPGSATTADISDLAYAVPALTLGVANAAGAADTVIRSDATILAFDAVNPVTLVPDAAAAVGVATVTAHRDHGHAIACAAPAVNLSVSSTNAEGAGNNFARSTHSHAITSSPDPGAAVSILATAADGGLELLRLGIGADPDTNNRITMVDGAQIGDTGEPLITFDNTLDYLEITGCDVGIGSAVPARRLWVDETDAATDTILPVLGVTHNSTNTPAALFGTAIDFYQESSTTADQLAARIQTLWTDATHASRNALLRFDTFPDGSAVGHFGFWSGNDIDNGAQVVIPGGSGDVTAIAYIGCAVSYSGGGTNSTSISLTPGNSGALYDVGGNTLTCAIVAGGQMTVQRTAGVGTYDAAIWFMWI
ncbi:MAG TPA: hypothetical protein VM223_10195, partial [Planctomycetota bacterium]|nr:hypothetical protein [Planctomycetota bacterium]